MNLREEPIIFINGKPYSLRNTDDMINNLILTGIGLYVAFCIRLTFRDRVLEIEKKFKQDNLLEASKNQSMIMVNDEDDKYRVTMRLIPVSTSTVSTVFDFYACDRLVGRGVQGCE